MTNIKIYVLIVYVLIVLLTSCTMDVDPSVANTPFGMQVLHYEFIIVLLSLCGGLVCLTTGIVLTILGFSGSIEWIVEASGVTFKLINASPGIILMVIGAWLTWKSKLHIKAKKNTK